MYMFSLTKQIVPLAVVCSVLLGYQYIGATWSDPTGTPPNNNVDAPLNTGSTAQVKNGSLSVDGLTVFGSQIMHQSAPTFEFSDSDHNDWWTHVNSNRYYFIYDEDDNGTWAGEDPWPLLLDGPGEYALFENQVRATEFCDRVGGDCFTPADVATTSTGGGGVPVVIAEETLPQGTNAGVKVAGANSRTLNTMTHNTIGASLSGGNITLPAGTYYARFSAAAGWGQNVARLVNNSGGAVLCSGDTGANPWGGYTSQHHGSCMLTLSGSTVVRLETYAFGASGGSNYGLGLAANIPGQVERFAKLELWQ